MIIMDFINIIYTVSKHFLLYVIKLLSQYNAPSTIWDTQSKAIFIGIHAKWLVTGVTNMKPKCELQILFKKKDAISIWYNIVLSLTF